MNEASCCHVPYNFVVDEREDLDFKVDNSEPILVEAMLVVGDLCPLMPFDSGFKNALRCKKSHSNKRESEKYLTRGGI